MVRASGGQAIRVQRQKSGVGRQAITGSPSDHSQQQQLSSMMSSVTTGGGGSVGGSDVGEGVASGHTVGALGGQATAMQMHSSAGISVVHEIAPRPGSQQQHASGSLLPSGMDGRAATRAAPTPPMRRILEEKSILMTAFDNSHTTCVSWIVMPVAAGGD
jgi:hypothetical protein